MNIGLAVHRNAIRNPNSEALFGDEPLSYEELDKKSNQIAHYLLSLGYEKGDRVAVLLPNRSEIIELIAGISKAALVYVGLNFRLGISEMEQIFEN